MQCILPSLKVVQHISVQNRFIASISLWFPVSLSIHQESMWKPQWLCRVFRVDLGSEHPWGVVWLVNTSSEPGMWSFMTTQLQEWITWPQLSPQVHLQFSTLINGIKTLYLSRVQLFYKPNYLEHKQKASKKLSVQPKVMS